MAESTSDSHTSRLSSLLTTGRDYKFDPSRCRYVCHTSTIPLATTVDEQYILRNEEDVVEVRHSTQYLSVEARAYVGEYRCCKKHCMYVGSATSEPEFLRSNCPCGQVSHHTNIGEEEVEVFLQPLCFLQVIKELRYDFGYIDKSEEPCETDDECCHNTIKRPSHVSSRPRIYFDEVMFCQNSQSIMDERYSKPLRAKVGKSGWQDINDGAELYTLLKCCYWFRKHASKKIKDEILQVRRGREWQEFKACVGQTLHTLNGLLNKKFLLFPCEMEGYKKLAEVTANLFTGLLYDYIADFGPEIPADHENSLFLRMKECFKFVKENLHADSATARMSCLSAIMDGNRNDPFSRFWGHSFSRLERRIRLVGYSTGDYTQSVAWINTMSGFSQTRNLGYLPKWVALQKRDEFRRTVGREKVSCTRSHLNFVYKIVQRRQADMGIPVNTLGSDNQVFFDAINAIELPLKPSASVNSTVSEGGKIEDARQLLNVGMHYGWHVPILHLGTGEVRSWLVFDMDLKTRKPNYEAYLFWSALQILQNKLSKTRPQDGWIYRHLEGSSKFEDTLFEMSIVHISEPGKERNLTKASALIAWVLTVCSKVCQEILANNQDHRAGLVLSAQDWMHQRRVAAESPEAQFLYDRNTGLRKDEIWNGFQDWTESTDYIPRQIGGVALKGYLDYIGFPLWYKRMVLVLSQVDYDVTEVLETEWIENRPTRRLFIGKVTEGFMMGNPLTKTILHLMHDVNIGTVHMLLRQMGIQIPNYQGSLEDPRTEHSWNAFWMDPGRTEALMHGED